MGVDLNVDERIERAIIVDDSGDELGLGFLEESDVVVPISIGLQVNVVGHLGPGDDLVQVDVL